MSSSEPLGWPAWMVPYRTMSCGKSWYEVKLTLMHSEHDESAMIVQSFMAAMYDGENVKR